ncbi:MAG: N-acetylglucosamine-6-phosphate deacetylase [Verrucomicrobia bacterium]|nr:MAG: N-acetylglucosamine-6-phosphate deacetylase [Verrucomicrobiota bacterium]
MDFGTTKGNQFRWATLSFGGSQRLPLQKSSRLPTMILTNARLIFPDGIRDGLEVVVHDGKIDAIRPAARARGKDVVDLAGNYLAPGFVDLHVHGALGRDTMEASVEAFRAICDYHASGGTTSLLLTTAAAPIKKLVEVLRAVRDWIVGAEVGTPRRGVRTAQRAVPTIAGVHVEGPFISKEKCGAQRAEFIQDPSLAAVQRLLEHADVIKRVTIAPELPGALETIENFRKHGISVSGGHSDAWDEDARAAFERGMRSVTHTFNCMSSARRRGVYRVGGLLEFALSEPQISCELIADGHHVSPTLMKMLYRAKGPGGICLVTDATAGAGLPDESRFSLFGNDCLVAGGVCLLSDRSALAGSAARMVDLVRRMVSEVNVPLHEAVAMATQNPAQAIDLQTKGRLRVGADADLVVLSPKLEILRVFTGGDELASNRQ